MENKERICWAGMVLLLLICMGFLGNRNAKQAAQVAPAATPSIVSQVDACTPLTVTKVVTKTILKVVHDGTLCVPVGEPSAWTVVNSADKGNDLCVKGVTDAGATLGGVK